MSKTKITICLILLVSVIISVLSPIPLKTDDVYAATTDFKVGQGIKKGTVTVDYQDKTITGQEIIITQPSGRQDRTIMAEYSDLDGKTHTLAIKDFRKSETEEWQNLSFEDTVVQQDTSGSDYSQEIESPCHWYNLLNRDCLLYGIANVVYYVIFRTTNFITMAGGVIFDASVAFSLSGEAFDIKNNAMLAVGWKTTRDFANMFFIFIILYIAITTILQLSSYGSKSLLIKVIIVALLINFSLMITRVVIDASHVLAWEFYNKIGDTEESQFVVDEPAIEINLNGLDKIAPQKRNLSAVFMSGFDPQKMTLGGKGYGEMLQMASEGGFFSVVWQIIVIYVLASVLNLVAAFILFAGAVLFIIRIVVLWFVMILAPLAFVGMILPGKMAGFAKTWWDKLFSQAFFAPAFLFLFYLVATLIRSDFVQNVIKAADNSPVTKVVGIDFGSTIIIIFHFIIIGGLTIGCLIIAQTMGAHGAGMVIGWGKKLQGAAQGYAGRIGMAPLAGMRRGAGFAGEKVATGEGRIAGILRKVPGVTNLSAYMASKNRAKIGELQKGYAKYSNKELENMLGGPMGVGFNRTAIIQELAKRKSLKDIADKHVQKATTIMGRYEEAEEKKGVDRLRPELVKGDVSEFMSATEKEHDDINDKYNKDPVRYKDEYIKHQKAYFKAKDYKRTGDRTIKEELQTMATEAAQEKVIKKIKAPDYLELADDVFDDKNKTIRKMIFNNLDSARMNKIIERGGVAMDKIMEDLINIDKSANSFEKVMEALEKQGNRSLAAWTKGFTGQHYLDSYGKSKAGVNWISAEEIKEQKKKKKKQPPSP